MQDGRTQLNIKIDAKTHYIANLAARHWGMTLAEFVESLIARGITEAAMRGDEPKVREPKCAPPQLEIWNESLWSEDHATRLFNLACTDVRLLTRSQRQLWTKLTAKIAANKQKLNAKTFRDHYNSAKDEE